MAKKKAEVKQEAIYITGEKFGEKEREAKRHCEAFKNNLTQKVAIGVLTKSEAQKELKKMVDVARKMRDKYDLQIKDWTEKKVEHLSTIVVLEQRYWDCFLYDLAMLKYKKDELEKEPNQTLKDIFKEGRYNDFLSIIEALNISSNGRIKRKRNLVAKALAVYEYAKKQDMIIDVKHTIFCKLFSLHYNGSSMIDSTISKAYNEKKRKDFLIVEKLLKDRK